MWHPARIAEAWPRACGSPDMAAFCTCAPGTAVPTDASLLQGWAIAARNATAPRCATAHKLPPVKWARTFFWRCSAEDTGWVEDTRRSQAAVPLQWLPGCRRDLTSGLASGMRCDAMRATRATRVTTGSAAALLPQRPAPRVKALALLEPQSPKAASCRCSCTPPTRMAAAQSRLPLRWQRVVLVKPPSVRASPPGPSPRRGTTSPSSWQNSLKPRQQQQRARKLEHDATAEAGGGALGGNHQGTRVLFRIRRKPFASSPFVRAAPLVPRATPPPAPHRAAPRHLRSPAPLRRCTAAAARQPRAHHAARVPRISRIPRTRPTHTELK